MPQANTARKVATLQVQPLAKALECKDETLQAAAAALIPVHVILSPRSQAKVAADAMDALKKLSGDTLTLNKMAPQQPCSTLLSYGIAAPTLSSRYSRFSMCASYTTKESPWCASAQCSHAMPCVASRV